MKEDTKYVIYCGGGFILFFVLGIAGLPLSPDGLIPYLFATMGIFFVTGEIIFIRWNNKERVKANFYDFLMANCVIAMLSFFLPILLIGNFYSLINIPSFIKSLPERDYQGPIKSAIVLIGIILGIILTKYVIYRIFMKKQRKKNSKRRG